MRNPLEWKRLERKGWKATFSKEKLVKILRDLTKDISDSPADEIDAEIILELWIKRSRK